MNRIKRYAVPAIALVAIAGCGGNAASPPEATTTIQPSSAKAEFVIGTANLFGTMTGMNVVATMRTPQGKSVLVSTPTLTGPFLLPATAGSPNSTGATFASGPSATEIARNGIISGTPQVVTGTPAGDIPATTFGIRGGLFATGFFPGNADNLGTVRDTPYGVPIYDDAQNPDLSFVDPNAFTPWGGPPAYDPNGNGEGTRDGTFDPSILGTNMGIVPFANTQPKVGAYKLSVIIPSNNGNVTISASANLPAITTLGNAVAPIFLPDGSGGGTFNVVLPSGATEGLVQITDEGAPDGGSNCQLGAGVTYYTVQVAGSQTVTLPDLDGARSGKAPFGPTPTLCTAAQNAAVGNTSGDDVFTVQLIAADYPIHSIDYLYNLNTQLPAIAGPNGSDDISISPVTVVGGGSSSPSSRLRKARGLTK